MSTEIITLQQLQDTFDNIHEQVKPLRKELDDKIAALMVPWKELYERWYDQELKDKNGITIRNEYLITNGKNSYKVHARRSQVIFGKLMDNPAVYARKLMPDGSLSKKEFSFYRRDLIDFLITEGGQRDN